MFTMGKLFFSGKAQAANVCFLAAGIAEPSPEQRCHYLSRI